MHRIVYFIRCEWLKSYIDYKSKRAKATTVFEKDFFKLMNNSIFGKTLEDIRKHSNVEVAESEKRLLIIIK